MATTHTAASATGSPSLLHRISTGLYVRPKLLLVLLLVPPLLWLGVIYLGSLFSMLAQSFFSVDDFTGKVVYQPTLGTYAGLFNETSLGVIRRTVLTAAVVTLICGAIAFPLAYHMARYAGPRGKAVFAALVAADRKAPRSKDPALAVKAKIAAELIDRAAAQYAVVQKDNNLEAYLDGLGFAMAAKDQAKAALPYLKKISPQKEAALRKALALAGQAYPGIKRSGEAKVSLADLQSAASAAKLAVSNLP